MKKLVFALALAASCAVMPPLLVGPAHAAAAAAATSSLGDLTAFEAIASDTLVLVKKNDMKAAEARITDFETAWDKAEPTLYPKNHDDWGKVDKAADRAIKALRTHPQIQLDANKAVTGLITALKNPAAL
jgi:hypothetical protein